MGLDFKIDVKGLKELDLELRTFTDDVQRKILDRANTAAGTVLIKEARTNVRRRTGKGARSISQKKSKQKSKFGTPVKEVGVFRGKGKRGQGWYLKLVETGTRPHTIRPRTKGGKLRLQGNTFLSSVSHPGARPKPWLAPAFRSSNKRMVQAYAKRLAKWIEKEHVSRGKTF